MTRRLSLLAPGSGSGGEYTTGGGFLDRFHHWLPTLIVDLVGTHMLDALRYGLETRKLAGRYDAAPERLALSLGPRAFLASGVNHSLACSPSAVTRCLTKFCSS